MAKKALSRNIYVVAAKRTPFGGFGGKLKNHSAIDLGVVAARAALAEGKVDPTKVDHVVFGNVAKGLVCVPSPSVSDPLAET